MEAIKRINLYQRTDSCLLDSLDDIIIKIKHKKQVNGIKTLLFCGSDPGVGTTSVVIDLAIALSEGKWRTLLIDSDMRKNSQHKHLSGQQKPGLSDFLEGKNPLEQIVYTTNHNLLSYIPSGSEVEHTLRLLGSRNLEKLLETVAPQYDFILLDSPSIDAANDAQALSLVADAVLLVAVPEYSNRENLLKMKTTLDGSDNKVLGVIINKVTSVDYRTHIKHYDYFTKQKYLLRTNKRGTKK